MDEWLSRRGPVLAGAAAVAALLLALAATRLLTAPADRDEVNFLDATRWIEERGWSAESLRTYPHLSPPLFYAALGLARALLPTALVLPVLRAAILIAGASVVWGLARRECRKDPASLMPLLAFPYFVFGSCHVYTDVPMLACGLWGWWSYRSGRSARAAVLWVLAIGFRQFGILFPVAALAATWIAMPAGLRRWRILAIAAPFAALGALFAFWGGSVPDSPFRADLAKLGVPLPEVLTWSVVCAGAYIGPFAAVWWLAGRLRLRAPAAGFALAALLLFIFFPPRTNRWYEVRGQAEAYWMLGYVDRAAAWLLGPSKVWLFAVLFVAGCWTIAALVRPLIATLRRRLSPAAVDSTMDGYDEAIAFHACLVLGFEAMNLATYIAWDKYLLPLVPSTCALLALTRAGSGGGCRNPGTPY
jgi:hypothetical protein